MKYRICLTPWTDVIGGDYISIPRISSGNVPWGKGLATSAAFYLGKLGKGGDVRKAMEMEKEEKGTSCGLGDFIALSMDEPAIIHFADGGNFAGTDIFDQSIFACLSVIVPDTEKDNVAIRDRVASLPEKTRKGYAEVTRTYAAKLGKTGCPNELGNFLNEVQADRDRFLDIPYTVAKKLIVALAETRTIYGACVSGGGDGAIACVFKEGLL